MTEHACPLCGAEVGDGPMCPHCRYPVNVRPLSEFGTADLLEYLGDLPAISAAADRPADELLDACVAMDWLRAETVIFNYRLIRAVERHAARLVHPTLDLGCGTGVFTTFLFGGRFDRADDGYGAIDLSRADAYDTHEQGASPRLVLSPRPIGIGIDLRQSMVARSRELGVYDDVHVADVRRLPQGDGAAASAFTNMYDDLPPAGLGEALAELRRVLAPGGHAVIASPDAAFRRALVYHARAEEAAARGDTAAADRYHAMDRGRATWLPRDRAAWQELLDAAGLELVAHEPFMDAAHIRFWDVGWRPFFPWTLDVRRNLARAGLLAAAKPTVTRLVREYVRHDATRPVAGDPAFSLVVARRA